MNLAHVIVERNSRNVVLERGFMIKKLYIKFNSGCVLQPLLLNNAHTHQ